jgi:predicted ribosome quality control (RQC) complex YloA/Tae2 family protein
VIQRRQAGVFGVLSALLTIKDMEPVKNTQTAADEDKRAKLELLAAAARRKHLTSIAKGRRLIANLDTDLKRHGDPDQWKRFGDLLLANAGNAKRQGDVVFVNDYFDERSPIIEIKGEANRSVTEIAEDYFRRYTKARNGLAVINERLAKTRSAIAEDEAMLRRIDAAAAASDIEYLTALVQPARPKAVAVRKKKAEAVFKGARRFVSSDGLLILVGKKAVDNDYLTFRIARSLDLWLHAADYPGSHVIVRSPNRNYTIPDRTLTEAAQLAAFYSDAREQPKAAVRYTQRKFVNKPRKGAPGLVSLASFKTILVEPGIGNARLEGSV